jgi:putative Holliday junction resolvase
MKAPIDAFMRNLRKRFGIEVEEIDESLSSWEASRSLSRAGTRARNQKRIIDTMAAREILQTWFEEQGNRPSSPAG